MTPTTIACARSVRDGGIDAIAVLNEALREAIAGVTGVQENELKLAFGKVMGEVVEELINPALRASRSLNLMRQPGLLLPGREPRRGAMPANGLINMGSQAPPDVLQDGADAGPRA